MYVTKTRVAVRISQSGHDPLDGYFALAPEPDAYRIQTVLELLNAPKRVIPFIVEGDGGILLLTRLNVDWVMVDGEVDIALVLPESHQVLREEPVELHFMNGTTIDGLMQVEGHRSDWRASDFLNAEPDFYAMTTRLGILLVNKTRVREARLGTAAPGWHARGRTRDEDDEVA